MSEAKIDAATLKVITKEAGRKAQDFVGFNELGSTAFFTQPFDSAKGEWINLEEILRVMNTPVDPEAEDKRGGSEHLAKMVMTATEDRICMIFYVPEGLQDKLTAKDWAEFVVAQMGPAFYAHGDAFTAGLARLEAVRNADKDYFPLKLKDQVIFKANDILRAKALCPAGDSSSDGHNYACDYEW